MTFARLVDHPEAAVRAALGGEIEGIRVATSGTTGRSREVLLDSNAIHASAEATHARLSGPGRWLLAIPPDRIGGAMVLARSALAGTVPLEMPRAGFAPARFVEATKVLVETTPVGVPLYASLVPTQWHRLSRDPAAVAAVDAYAAILVGGAAMGSGARPSRVIETYGATETAGGCVYDGRPLDGVSFALDADGHVLLAGPTLARGYVDGDDSDFALRGSVRWWRSADVGAVREGRLVVEGRADDVIVTGGHKVHPVSVERAIARLPGIEGCVVVGVPDEEWGERVVALVSVTPGATAPAPVALRAELRDALPHYALPRAVLALAHLPLLASGKIDRETARRLAAGHSEA